MSKRRIAHLNEILTRLPGNDCSAQRDRMLAAIRELGSISTLEAMRHLDVYDPRPRIKELRASGHKIDTHFMLAQTESGQYHRIGKYVAHPTSGKATS